MSEFIAEFRTRSNPLKPSAKLNACNFSPKMSRNYQLSPPATPDSDLYLSKPSYFHSNEDKLNYYHSNEDVLSYVSQKQFSKDHISQLLRSSVTTLVEKFLAGRSISSITGHIQVSLCQDSIPISVVLNEIFSPENKYQHHSEESLNIKCKELPTIEKQNEKSASHEEKKFPNFLISEYNSSENNEKEEKNNSQAPSHSQNEGSFLSVPENQYRRRDSDVESGYNSCTDSYNFARKLSNCSTDSNMSVKNNDRNEPDEDSEESRLVIDIPTSDNSSLNSETNENADMSADHDEDCCENIETSRENVLSSDANKENLIEVSTEEAVLDENEEHISSCSDGTDIEMDVSGSGSSSSEISESSPQAAHPQSMVLERTSGNVACKLCQKVLSNTEDVPKHALEEHNLFSCHICFRTFTAKNNMKRHVRLHTGLRPYKCPHCSLTFARRDDMKCHKLRHNYKKPYRCAICKKGYTDRACVKNHMVKEHGSMDMHFCPQCGESFDNHEEFSIHKKSHPELQQFACKDCYFIGNNALMTMKHSLIHEHALFSCKPCNAHYSDPFDYTNHLRKHKRDESFTSYACCFCKTVLSTYDHFMRHEYTHAQGKLYTCKICKKQFKGKTAFQEHSMTHSDEADCEGKDAFQYQTPEEEEPVTRDSLSSDVSQQQENDIKLEENTSKSDDNEALDLTMKKTPSIQDKIDSSSKSVNSNLAVTRQSQDFSSMSAPRNGCMSEILVKRSDSKSFEDEIIEIEDVKTPFFENKITPGSQINQNVNRFEFHPYDKQQNLRNKILSRGGRDRSFISPYRPNQQKVKENLLDLISKFHAARGGQMLPQSQDQHIPKENEQSIFSPSNHHLSQRSRTGSNEFLYNLNKMQNTPTYFSSAGNRNTEDENNKPLHEHYLTSQLPTFIKNEQIEDERSKEQRHFRINHRSSHSQQSVTPNSYQSFRRENNSSNRVLKVEPKKGGYECDSCKEVFLSFQELEGHCVAVHKRYPCQHCQKTFTARPNRDRHVRFHTGERPYKCDLCNQAFHRGDDLKYHRTTRHASSDKMSCSRCSATFSWVKDLEKHLRNGKCFRSE